jgi:acyl carrier protein
MKVVSNVTGFVTAALAKRGVAEATQSDVLAGSLSSLGLDSLDFMELLNEIEEMFEVCIEDDTLSASATVTELIAFIEGKIAARSGAPSTDRP